MTNYVTVNNRIVNRSVTTEYVERATRHKVQAVPAEQLRRQQEAECQLLRVQHERERHVLQQRQMLRQQQPIPQQHQQQQQNNNDNKKKKKKEVQQ